MNNVQLIFTFIFIVLLSLTIHEFGHFIFAKIFKVTVYELSIGIGPKLFSVKHNKTIYSLRLIPIMAYVLLSSNSTNKLYKEIISDIENKSKLDPNLLKLTDHEHFISILKNKFSIENYKDYKNYKEYRKYKNLYIISSDSKTINSVSFFKNIIIISGGIFFNIIFFGISIIILIYGLNQQIDIGNEIQLFFINLWNTLTFQEIESSIIIGNNFSSVFFFLMIMINLSLFLLNILPIPPLDGFKVVLLILERTTKKSLPEKFDLIFGIIGIIFIVYLSIASIIGLII